MAAARQPCRSLARCGLSVEGCSGCQPRSIARPGLHECAGAAPHLRGWTLGGVGVVKVGPTTDLFKQKLLDINVWAMTLILALVFQQAPGSIVSTVSARYEDSRAALVLRVWAQVYG